MNATERKEVSDIGRLMLAEANLIEMKAENEFRLKISRPGISAEDRYRAEKDYLNFRLELSQKWMDDWTALVSEHEKRAEKKLFNRIARFFRLR